MAGLVAPGLDPGAIHALSGSADLSVQRTDIARGKKGFRSAKKGGERMGREFGRSGRHRLPGAPTAGRGWGSVRSALMLLPIRSLGGSAWFDPTPTADRGRVSTGAEGGKSRTDPMEDGRFRYGERICSEMNPRGSLNDGYNRGLGTN